MIGLVRVALRRPYTMAIAGMLILMMGFLSVKRMVVDIFPNIDIPVVSVVWTYSGLSTEEMEQHITTFSEFSTSFAVSNIKNIESQTTNGVAVVTPTGCDIYGEGARGWNRGGTAARG